VISRKFRVPAIAATAAAITLLAAGCGSGASSSTTTTTLAKVSGLEKTTLNVAAVPAMDSAGFFVALHDGLFSQEGLTINYTPAVSSDTVIAGQLKGQYDITMGNYVSYIEAQATGETASAGGLDIIDEGSVMEEGSQVILALPKSHIDSLADLKGKYVAVNAPQNIDQLLLDSTLTDQGISPTSVHVDAGVPFPSMLTALEHGSYDLNGRTVPVDAEVLPEPFASEVEESLGAITVADLDQGATTAFPIEGAVVTKDWAKANPNTLQAFVNAFNAGQNIADSDRAAVETAFESLNGPQNGQVSDVIASMMALNTYPIGVDETRIQRVANVMQQFGVLSKSFNVATMIGS
jgi:NitT/TauT family transport system substrate-binding protein